MNPRLLELTCFDCGLGHGPEQRPGVCRECGKPLGADYDLEGVEIEPNVPSLWRYRQLLPVSSGEVSLLEGWTPLIPMGPCRWLKDESRNPTGSFKARGMSVAVSAARLLGAEAVMAPSAGNAAAALAAYGAAARIPVTVAVPEGTPEAVLTECRHYGAAVQVVGGSIADAGAWLAGHGPERGTDLATMQEPYRVEGKKTMAYELFEQLRGDLPDVVVCPTGGGTGLVGMWRAFGEMERMGWIGRQRPRLIAIQAEGCAPIVQAFQDGSEEVRPWPEPCTAALGLRVPAPIGGFLCLRALRETGGTAWPVSEAEISSGAAALGDVGIDAGPEGGAAWAGMKSLEREGLIGRDDRVVVFNTGTGLKYR